MQLYMHLNLIQYMGYPTSSLLTNKMALSIIRIHSPVHADTIIDKILIKTLTTASGVITMKDKEERDSIININDSLDLRKN